jgi:hypothetical protein
MAYVPPTALPVAPPYSLAPSNFVGQTTGSVIFPDYSAHLMQIIVELNKLNYNLSSISTAEPGSFMAIQSLQANNSETMILEHQLNTQAIQNLVAAVQGVSKAMATQTTGVANIATTMTKQLVVAETATMDQIKNNQLTQAIAKQAQVDAGKPPVVVSPEAFITRVEATVNDVLSFRAITFAANTVTQAVNDTITTAYTTSVTWIGQTAVAQWIQTTYLEAEIFLTSIFSKAKAEQLALKLKSKAENAVKNPTVG